MNQHDKDIEEQVLGALLLYPQNLTTITPILKDEYFYQFQTKTVYRAIVGLFEKSEPVEVGTVMVELKKTNQLDLVGGVYFLSALTRLGDVSITTLEFKCRVIHQLYILRQLSILGQEIQNASLTPNADCFEIIDRINLRSAELTDIRSENVKSVGDVFNEMVSGINDVLDKGLPTGLMTGLENVDRQSGGWQNGNLIVLAARPGMGKTAFSLHLVKYPAVTLNIPTVFFSLEMTALELVGRLSASESSISNTSINQKKINRVQLASIGASCSKLVDSPIYIDDTPALTIGDLKAKSKKLYYEKGIKLIVVDYLQLMSGSSGKGNRDQEISEISRGLKALAKELNIPVIALSQLSRKCEDRADKRPILSDLRESGAIEQDADIVGFLFRPVEYGLFEEGYPYGTNVLDTPNLMLFDIAKGRGMPTGEIPLRFNGEFMQIENYRLRGQVEQMEPGSPIQTNENFLDQINNGK